jgi:hypothetical protein
VTATPTASVTAPGDSDHDGLNDGQEITIGTCPGLQPAFQTLPQCHLGGSVGNGLIPDPSDTDGDGLTDGQEFFTYGTNPLALDTDNDVLTDTQEIAYYHTNPLATDTDGDGLWDFAEVFVWHTDPLAVDTDHDGLGDGLEIASTLTEPLNPNTDGTGCSDGAELGSDHTTGGQRDPANRWDFFDVPVPALSSTQPAGVRDGAIGLADALAVLFYVGTGVGQVPNANGARYDADNNVDGLADGKDYDRSASTDSSKPWQTGPPDGAVTLLDVILLSRSVGDQCANLSWPPNDADHDGLPDLQEVSLGTCPGLQSQFASLPQCHVGGNLAAGPISDPRDTDGDGLLDAEEFFAYLTDPKKRDTDGDGCSDGQERGVDHHSGGQRDPLAGSDFYDVPLPVLAPGQTTGVRNHAVTLLDVLAVLRYVGAAQAEGSNGNGVAYDADVNADGRADGLDYDRGGSAAPGQPWRVQPPNGTITLLDVLSVVPSVGDGC